MQPTEERWPNGPLMITLRVAEPVPFEGVSQVFGRNPIVRPPLRQRPHIIPIEEARLRNPGLLEMYERLRIPLVHEVASVPATAAQMQQVIHLLQEIRDDVAGRDQAAQVLEQSPYSGLLRYLPEGKEQWYVFIALLVAILTLIVQTAEIADKPPTVIVKVDEEKIVREIEEHLDQRLDEDKSANKPPYREHC